MTDRREAWRVTAANFPANGSRAEQLSFLVRYAILAPSSHNSQPWKFVMRDDVIDVYVDPDRWLRVADPDQRELYVSVGCAIENLRVAADHFGLGTQVEHSPALDVPSLAASVRVSPTRSLPAAHDPALFAALTSRHTSHGSFNKATVASVDVAALAFAAGGDVITILRADAAFKQSVDGLMTQADALQFADPHWRAELSAWLGDGAFGQPWFIAKLASLAVKHLDLGRSEARKDHEGLMSAPLFGAICTTSTSSRARVEAGQAFERLWLAAECRGLCLQPMNQVLQIAGIAASFVKLLACIGGEPAILFRLGYGDPRAKPTPRRPLEDVLGSA